MLRKDDGTLLVVVRVVTRDEEGNGYDYPWVECVDAEGGGEQPFRQQAARWKANYAEKGQGDKPLPS